MPQLGGVHGNRLRAASLVAVIVLAATGHATAQEPPWATHIRAVDEALARHDVALATRQWQEAYVAALGSWRWDGMLEVGDAHLRIGEVSGQRQAALAKARNAYLAALFRARHQDSLEGVLRTAEAFVMLGDREVVELCLRIARDLAGRNGDPRLRALAARLAEWPAGAGPIAP